MTGFPTGRRKQHVKRQTPRESAVCPPTESLEGGSCRPRTARKPRSQEEEGRVLGSEGVWPPCTWTPEPEETFLASPRLYSASQQP